MTHAFAALLLLDGLYRASAADDVDDPNAEPVDALTMGRMMALVAQQGGDLDVALEQVCAWLHINLLFWVVVPSGQWSGPSTV